MEIENIYTSGHGMLIKMATIPIYGKTAKKIFSRTKKASRLNLGIQQNRLKVYQICSNDEPRLTFDLFTASSSLHPPAFVWGKMLKSRFLKMY